MKFAKTIPEKLAKLNKLAEKYPTDKKTHSYLESYAKYLPDNCRSMLEIGVAEGYSALMWFEYFGKDLDLSLIDLFQNPDFKSVRWCRERHFVPYQGNQNDMALLSSIKTQFSLVIDDGSHNAFDQIASFKHLFVNNLQSGGLFVIEDLHCNKEEFYWGNGVHSFADTILSTLKHFNHKGVIDNILFNEGESEVFQNLISKVEIVNDKIAFIWKR